MYRYFIYCRKSTEGDDHQAISLESQHRELIRYAEERSLPVIKVFFERRSARMPGRPIFGEILNRVARGEANGILAWHPDRLARNAVDGGQIVHFLDTGKLEDLRFPTFAFENSPQGKFMLAIVFGHSKYEVDTLSEHVKRGNRTKREMGWLPGPAPLGYLNIRSDSGAKIIGRDPERFPIVKRLWDLFLTGQHSGAELLAIATDQLGLRTRRRWRTGGKLVSRASLYALFKNPFYTGHIVFNGHWYLGSHEPMVAMDEFNRAQRILRGSRIRSRAYRFPYSRLMSCGNCGASITAERKQKPSGRTYTYYHCTHRKKEVSCREGSIEEKELERQIIGFFAIQNRPMTLANQASIRALLTLKASSVTLQGKRVRIEAKFPQ